MDCSRRSFCRSRSVRSRPDDHRADERRPTGPPGQRDQRGEKHRDGDGRRRPADVANVQECTQHREANDRVVRPNGETCHSQQLAVRGAIIWERQERRTPAPSRPKSRSRTNRPSATTVSAIWSQPAGSRMWLSMARPRTPSVTARCAGRHRLSATRFTGCRTASLIRTFPYRSRNSASVGFDRSRWETMGSSTGHSMPIAGSSQAIPASVDGS